VHPLTGQLYVRLLGIPHTKPHTKFKVYSSSIFGDMLDCIGYFGGSPIAVYSVEAIP